jgi:hypothetical protein
MSKKFATAVAALLLTSTALYAANPPEMMEGLWSIRNHTIDNPGNKKTDSTSTLCRSHAYDQHVLELAKTMIHCTINESVDANKFSVTTHCVVACTVVDSTSTAIFTGNTAAYSETRATYNPALGGISEMSVIQDEKYLGSCPPGLRPGDMTRADGTVVHLWTH